MGSTVPFPSHTKKYGNNMAGELCGFQNETTPLLSHTSFLQNHLPQILARNYYGATVAKWKYSQQFCLCLIQN